MRRAVFTVKNGIRVVSFAVTILGKLCVENCFVADLPNSTVTIPVGTAMMP